MQKTLKHNTSQYKRSQLKPKQYTQGYTTLKQDLNHNKSLLLITLTLFTLYALYIVIMY